MKTAEKRKLGKPLLHLKSTEFNTRLFLVGFDMSLSMVLNLSYILQWSPGLTPSCPCRPTAPPVQMVDALGSPGHILAGGVQVTPTAPSPDIKSEGLDEAVFHEAVFKQYHMASSSIVPTFCYLTNTDAHMLAQF